MDAGGWMQEDGCRRMDVVEDSEDRLIFFFEAQTKS
jgi:hypothetical protein